VIESGLITSFSAFTKITKFLHPTTICWRGWRPCLTLRQLLHLFRVSGEFISYLLTFFRQTSDCTVAPELHWELLQCSCWLMSNCWLI